MPLFHYIIMKKEESRHVSSTVFEGITSISAVINSKSRSIDKIIIDEQKIKNKAREIAFIEKHRDELGYDIVFESEEYINELTTGNSHGGFIALCGERTLPSLDELVLKENGFYAMIEGIEDPYNFGYAIRSLYAAGVDAIILTKRNWMSAAGVVCRSSAGASELLPVYVSDSEEACDYFRNHKIKTAAAGIRNSVPADEADLSLPLFLVVGGEKRGLSAAVTDKADMIIRLEYGREFRGSLSAASAASILAYEILRQNKNILIK